MAVPVGIKVPSVKQTAGNPEVETPAKVFSRGPGSKLTYGSKAPASVSAQLKPPVASKRVSNRGARLRKQF